MTVTIAQRIEADLKAEIVKAGRTITDPVAFIDWMEAMGIGRTAVAAACRVPTDVVGDRMRAAFQGPQGVGTDTYERLSQPLTPDIFPGRPPLWDEWKPLDVMLARLSDIASDTVAVLYFDMLGRLPDPAGRAHYEAQMAAGRPRWEIVREIELSDEARAKSS